MNVVLDGEHLTFVNVVLDGEHLRPMASHPSARSGPLALSAAINLSFYFVAL